MCHADGLFLPVALLYRHALELQLKEIISLAIRVELLDQSDELTRARSKHGLLQLWNYVRRAIKTYWPDGGLAELQSIESVVLEFHKVDASGQRLRYARDTSGRPAWTDLPDAADLEHLRQTMRDVFDLLEGCACAFQHEVDFRMEYLSSMQM